MNLLNNIFEAYLAHDFRLLDSYLHTILSQYISKYKSTPEDLHSLTPHFKIFQPSKILTLKNNADFFDIVYRSEDDIKKIDKSSNDGETKLSISRDLSPKIDQNSLDNQSPTKKQKIKNEWLKSLSKVFSILDSKAIKKLLLLLEHPKQTTRKMIMILFQVLLESTQNKIHFVEKCAIGFSPGVYIVSRMKYIYSAVSDSKQVFGLMISLRKHFKTIQIKLEIENKRIQGI